MSAAAKVCEHRVPAGSYCKKCDTSGELVVLSQAQHALAAVETVQDAKGLYDQLEALSQYARRYRLEHDQQNDIAEAKLRTARKGGALIPEQYPKGNLPGRKETLADAGLSYAQSSRWQALAGLTDEVFEQHLATTKDSEKELTLAGALRLVPRYDDPAGEVAPLPEGVYRTICADPPWQYGNTSTRGAAEDHYPTMTIDELCALEVAPLAADEAHLYLWTTNGFLREAFDVMDAWGFDYKTTLVWVKPQIGMGNYFRSSSEYVLFGVRGGLRTLDCNQRNWFEAKRTRHSKKPGRFFEMVETASPGPYLEMFARERRLSPEWSYWGNEA